MADIQERFVKIGEKILYEGVELTLREVLRDTNGHIWGIAISNCGTPYALCHLSLALWQPLMKISSRISQRPMQRA